MSWSSWAANLVGSKPVWVYRIEKDGEVAFYTSRFARYSAAPTSMQLNIFDVADFFSRIDFFAETFYPVPIAHTAIRETQNASRKNTTITLPRTDVFAQKFLGDLGVAETKVTIWQGFENDVAEEFPRMFRGDVQLVKPTFATISLICEDDGNLLRSKALPAVVQRPCRHALYHGECTLLLANFQDAGTATAFANNIVTVTEASAQIDGFYSGGIIGFGTSLQLITSHTGTQLTVLSSVGTLEATISASGPQSVTIARGCDRSIAICDTKFSNSLNHGGFPYMSNSPFDGRSIT